MILVLLNETNINSFNIIKSYLNVIYIIFKILAPLKIDIYFLKKYFCLRVLKYNFD